VKLTEEQVRAVAELAHLELSADEIHRMAHDLDGILTHIDKLNEIDTANVEPMAQVIYKAEETATLRDDLERPTLSNDDALANAPQAGAGYFKIPKVIER
jgi:aspartyl-tRNA(Asn)/glutamyl-tRNA(Gln) amidotransferase subunit C